METVGVSVASAVAESFATAALSVEKPCRNAGPARTGLDLQRTDIYKRELKLYKSNDF